MCYPDGTSSGACEGVYLPAGAVEYRLSTALGSASNALDPVGVCREQLKLAGKRRAIVSDECGAVVYGNFDIGLTVAPHFSAITPPHTRHMTCSTQGPIIMIRC